MAMANMNVIGIFVTKLCRVQALACSGGDGGGGDGGDGGRTKNIIPPKFSNFGDIITYHTHQLTPGSDINIRRRQLLVEVATFFQNGEKRVATGGYQSDGCP